MAAAEAASVPPPVDQSNLSSTASKLLKLDPRMIRDGEVTNEEMGLGVDMSTRLG